MASIVKSVEKFAVALPASTAFVETDLNLDQDYLNCIPFITKRVTTAASTTDDWVEYLVDTSMVSGTPDKVRVETTNSATRALVVEITVVEFWPSEVKIQQGVYGMLDTEGSGNATIPEAVTLGNSFLVHSWQGGSPDANESSAIRGLFASNVLLTFDRFGTTNAVDGHWFVAEAIAGGFTVQTANPILTPALTTVSDTSLTGRTDNKTLLVGSYSAQQSADNNNPIPWVFLASATTVTATRKITEGEMNCVMFAITFTGAEVIERGVFHQSTSETSESLAITQVTTPAETMCWITANTPFKNAGGNNSNSLSNVDVQVGLDLESDVLLRFQHGVTGAETDIDIAWEVIQWDVDAGGASVRRVMVIS